MPLISTSCCLPYVEWIDRLIYDPPGTKILQDSLVDCGLKLSSLKFACEMMHGVVDGKPGSRRQGLRLSTLLLKLMFAVVTHNFTLQVTPIYLDNQKFTIITKGLEGK